MKDGWGGLLVAGLIAVAQPANAQSPGPDQIFKSVAGTWVANSASCDAPSLVVITGQPGTFLFKFNFPKSRELQFRESIPPPQIVGSPPTVAFEAPGAARPNIWIEARMPDLNTLDLRFYEVDDPATRYRRCNSLKVG